ncbi:MAG TPA: penicillin-binding protein 2, partial [Usitatibacter sp.]|nr:penicillin-binding protein 2 [Usitatibacter sp.]
MLASLGIVLAFGLLLARFTWLQVVQREYYHTLAEANRISVVPVVPNRGLIIDRNGEVLAANYSAYTLEITPSRVTNVERAIDELATVIEITARDRRRFKKLQEESKNFESLPIRTRLTEEEVARFAVNRFRFPGFEIKARLFRSYPQGAV